MLKTLFCLLFVACLHLPHVEPEPRYPDQAVGAAVMVQTRCQEADPFNGEVIDWNDPHVATGVVISERHVLTAAHVVRCGVIPYVKVTLTDGRWFRMAVERDDAMFGDGTDIARLVIASAERFEINLAPPELGYPTRREYAAVAVYKRPLVFGEFIASNWITNSNTGPGDSGAGVYSLCGKLVGLVVGGTGKFTEFVPVNNSWLSGT